MACAWILRNEYGVVRAISMAAYTEPKRLEEWKADGHTPELVDFGDCEIVVNATLPYRARVIDRF